MNNEHYDVSDRNPDAKENMRSGLADNNGESGAGRAYPQGDYTVSPDGETVDDGAVFIQQQYRHVERNGMNDEPGSSDMRSNDSGRQTSSPRPFKPNAALAPDTNSNDAESYVVPPQPFKPMASINPDTPTSASVGPDGPVAAGQGKASARKGLPFKPMSGSVGSVSRETAASPMNPVKGSKPDRQKNRVSAFVPEVAVPAQPKPLSDDRLQNPAQPDQRFVTLKEMEKNEDRRYEAEMQQYNQAMSKWKSRLWIPFALLAGLLILILLGGAFAGAVGVVFVLLAAFAAIAILAAMGKMKWVFPPKKPQKQQPRMETPELASVYSVRLRLKSMNLPKPIEVVIRKEEQLLGCDRTLCVQPLEYKGISHRHCTIISRYQHGHTEYYIRDENSKNGTRLNERRLDPGVEYPVQIGDVITLAGRYQFKVLSDAY